MEAETYQDPAERGVCGVIVNVHPEATGAVLQKDSTLWFLVFTGPSGAKWDMQLVTPHELSDALSHGYSDADVVSYIERQLAVRAMRWTTVLVEPTRLPGR